MAGATPSVKTRTGDLMGREVDVLCVKGSGADMATIGPAGCRRLRLAELRELRAREALSDEDMVRVARHLIDTLAPKSLVRDLAARRSCPTSLSIHTHSTRSSA